MIRKMVLLCLIVFFLPVCTLFSGCAGSGINFDAKEFVIDVGASMVGYELAKDYPGQIDAALNACDALIEGNIKEAVLQGGVDYLIAKYASHPILGMHVRRLAASVSVDSSGVLDIPKLQKLAPAFRDGLLAARAENLLRTIADGE